MMYFQTSGISDPTMQPSSVKYLLKIIKTESTANSAKTFCDAVNAIELYRSWENDIKFSRSVTGGILEKTEDDVRMTKKGIRCSDVAVAKTQTKVPSPHFLENGLGFPML